MMALSSFKLILNINENIDCVAWPGLAKACAHKIHTLDACTMYILCRCRCIYLCDASNNHA